VPIVHVLTNNVTNGIVKTLEIAGKVKVKEKKVEVRQVSERETWVGENRVYLGEDNMLYCITVGGSDEKRAIAMKEAIFKLMNMAEGRMKMLLDINRAGQVSSAARKIGKEMLEDEKVGKAAFVGLHPVARVIASFIMGVSRKKDMRFFRKKEEALAWLEK